MGDLLQGKTGRRLTLAARTLLGRSRRCDLQVPHKSVSGEHAVIWWDGACWWIRDLGSRNGTKVDGEPLSHEQALMLTVGACIELGSHPLTWTVESVGPVLPRAVAAAGGASVEAADEILALPDDDAPLAVIYGEPSAGFILEQGDDARPIHDLEEVMVGGEWWRLHLPQLLEPTAEAEATLPRLSDPRCGHA